MGVNRCEVYDDNGQIYVHFMINTYHSETKSFENWEDAQKEMKDWIKSESHPY